MIREEFIKCLAPIVPVEQSESMWQKVETHYTDPGRYYHTLDHLEALFRELSIFRDKFTDWNAVIFAIVYHDIIYDVHNSDNEERSASLAHEYLSEIAYPVASVSMCERMILATKKHEAGDNEINLFTDADLSILGSTSGNYQAYTKQIRQEYLVYPDDIYREGRQKVLRRFLDLPRIYKTDGFESKYESQARKNISEELMLLMRQDHVL